LEEGDVEEKVLRKGLGGVDVKRSFGAGDGEVDLEITGEFELGASEPNESEVGVFKRDKTVGAVGASQSK
jgi:hypothetical protein